MSDNLVPDFKQDETGCTMSKIRQNVALEATYEIYSVAEALRKSVPLTDDGHFYTVRALTSRLHELNSIIMSAIGEEYETTTSLGIRLRLEHEEVTS